MRLPTPIYERIPQFWFLLGLLFIADGLYLGIDFSISLLYIAAGFICCTYGVGIGVLRMRYRGNRSTSDDSASTTQ